MIAAEHQQPSQLLRSSTALMSLKAGSDRDPIGGIVSHDASMGRTSGDFLPTKSPGMVDFYGNSYHKINHENVSVNIPIPYMDPRWVCTPG